MKANHNRWRDWKMLRVTVSYGSMILKWKQITTHHLPHRHHYHCFLWFKDTKMKANHNGIDTNDMRNETVSYGSKILKWKQITTSDKVHRLHCHCFLWFKDTKMKANHNPQVSTNHSISTVSYGSKILKWKQITTYSAIGQFGDILFPMVQRY